MNNRTARYFMAAVSAVVTVIGWNHVYCQARTVDGVPAQAVVANPDGSAAEDSGEGCIVLTIEECRDLALRNNVNVLNARLDVLAAKAQKGEAFNETSPLRAGPDSWIFGAANEDVCALVMMTDGIFDIACPWLLSKSAQPVYVNYIRPFMDINILKVSSPEDFEHAQAEITEFFGSPDSRQITDDKTIVGIINTEVTPEVRPESYYEEPDWEALAREHRERLYDRGETMQEASGLSRSSPQQTDAVAECGKKAPEPLNDSGQSNDSEKRKASVAREPLETGRKLLKKLFHKSRKEAEESDRM